MNKKDKILITGGKGMVGTALAKELLSTGYNNIIVIGSKQCDLRNYEETERLFDLTQPKYVFHLAGRVYGLGGNTLHKDEVLYDNLMINTNVVKCSQKFNIKKIVAMGSGCIYPELPVPLKEEDIWNGKPHKSELYYAHAKRMMLAHLIACKEQYGTNYVYAISGNLYGENDKFNPKTGHVIPSLIFKFYEAIQKNKKAVVWGTGIAKRDFCYSADTARALICLMDKAEGAINIGSGKIYSIKEVVETLQGITGVDVKWNPKKPNGQLERYYDLRKLKNFGFQPKISLREGLKRTWNWYVNKCKERG